MRVSGTGSGTSNLILQMLYSIPGVLLFLRHNRDYESNLVILFLHVQARFCHRGRINVNESIDPF